MACAAAALGAYAGPW